MIADVNGMIFGVLAAVGRKNYEDRRRRQGHRQPKPKAEGKYRATGVATSLKAQI
jgi:hypothetical protein